MITKWMFPDPNTDKSICHMCGNRNKVTDWLVWPANQYRKSQVTLYFVCDCGWTRIDRVSSNDR